MPLPEFDGEAFLRQRRIIQLRSILSDIAKALEEAVSVPSRQFLEESRVVFEKELAELIDLDRQRRT